MHRPVETIAAEFKEQREALERAYHGDGHMYLLELQSELAAAFLADNPSLVGMQCRIMSMGKKFMEDIYTVIEPKIPVPNGSIEVKSGNIGIVSSKSNFMFLICGEWIRLFKEPGNG
jgi:hypothetical protein